MSCVRSCNAWKGGGVGTWTKGAATRGPGPEMSCKRGILLKFLTKGAANELQSSIKGHKSALYIYISPFIIT